MVGTLLSTKLRAPAARPEGVLRPHLLERLDQGLTQKLTLVSAPPGFGKTTLLSQWITHRALPVAWLSLDKADNDLARFMSYLVAALQSIRPGIGQELLATLQSPQPLPVEPVLTSLVNQMVDSPDALVLVLDDYHLIELQPVHDAVAFLLDYLPEQVHLILSCRADPPLPLARLRGRGQVVELRASDLRFTDEETAEFLRRFTAREMSDGAVTTLTARTEGWIAGLQMAAVSMHGREDVDGFVRDFAGSNRYILDYLMEEVFRLQPQDLQFFLLKTAILDRLTGPLCDAVTGQGEGTQTLERLERANLFTTPLDEEGRWYRYHRLFADLLQRQLGAELPDLVPELHRRASGWFEQQGFPHEAIDHALSAEDFERAAWLINRHAEAALGQGEGTTLSGWLGRLPVDLVRSQSRLSIFYATALFISGRLHDAERWLEVPDTVHSEVYGGAVEQGMVAAIRALMAVLRFDLPSAIRFSNQALKHLPEADTIWHGIATMALGDAQVLKGDWIGARTAYEETLATARRSGNDWLVLVSSTRLASIQRGRGHLREAADYCRQQLQLVQDENDFPVAMAGWMYALSTIYCEQNELDIALDYARKSCELSDRAGYVFLSVGAYRALVRVLFSRGEMAAAEDAMNTLERVVGTADLPHVIANSLTEWKSRLLMARGEMLAAEHLLADRGVDLGDEITIINHANHRCLARLLIAKGRHEDALVLLDRLLKSAESAGMARDLIETLALRALALQGQGDLSRALDSLERALSMGEPEGFVRTFVNEGTPMARLLYEAAAQGVHSEYTGRLLAAFPTSYQPSAAGYRQAGLRGRSRVNAQPSTQSSVPSTQSVVVEPLSERELDVLRLVAEGLSNEETARRLVLSLPTVKWHTSNIYGKLGVSSRTQAVVKARALGLLPAS